MARFTKGCPDKLYVVVNPETGERVDDGYPMRNIIPRKGEVLATYKLVRVGKVKV